MNARYRKQQRLRTRHARRGHSRVVPCNCPEQYDRLLLALRRWKAEHKPLPRRTVRTRTEA